jgi:CheY-like chemotaxis protein
MEQNSAGRVLVVDDEPDVSAGIVFALEQRGLSCATAQTGPEALLRASQFAPQVILLDLNLPGLDGLEVCLRLRAAPLTQHSKIFVVSARANDRDMFLTHQVGATGFIPKPFTLKHLADTVCSALK